MKQVQLLMTKGDEKLFSDLLKARFPQITFLDGRVWAMPIPLERVSIDRCKTSCAYLWDKQIFEAIPIGAYFDGQFEGPANGPVLQYFRSLHEEPILSSGSISAGFSKDYPKFEELNTFTKEVWKILRKHGSSKLICVDPETLKLINPNVTGYLAWPGAIDWVLEKQGRFFKDRVTWNFYLPASTLKQ